MPGVDVGMSVSPEQTMSPPAPTNVLATRTGLLAAAVAVFLVTCSALCRVYTPDMLYVLGTCGVAAAAWVAGGVGVGLALLRLARVDVRGCLGVATAGGVGLGAFSLVGLGLGLLGWLNRPVAVAFPVVGWGWLAVECYRRPPPPRAWLNGPVAAADWLWLVPVLFLAAAAVAASVMPGVLWGHLDPSPYDVTSYHLQVPREWYDAGRIVPLRHNMYSYFPFNVEVQFLLLDHAAGGRAAPWTSMYAAQFVCVGYAVLMVLAVAGAGNEGEHRTSNIEHRTSKRQKGEAADPSAFRRSAFDVRCSMFALNSSLSAAVASSVPWVVMLAGVAYVEPALMLYSALAVAWAMRAVGGGAFVRPMVVAGVAAGLACGTKITAVPMLLLAVPAVAAVAAWTVVPRRPLLLGCGGAVVAGGLVLSPWLVRNAVWSHGNPIWPVGMSALGAGHFSPAQVERFRVAHSPTPDQQPPTARVAVLWTDVLAHWQYGYVLLPAGIAAAAGRRRDRQTWVLVGTALVVLVVWVGFTHLLARFFVMTIPLAAIAVGRAGWRRAGWGVAAAAAVTGIVGVARALDPRSSPADVPPPGWFGRTDLSLFLPTEEEGGSQVKAAIVARDRDVGLVGNAQAFFYQTSSDRLHYSTVFDLPGDETDPVAAWVGRAAEGNPEWLLVVNPDEVQRLNTTYRSVPPMPSAWVPYLGRTLVLTGDQWPPRVQRRNEPPLNTDEHR